MCGLFGAQWKRAIPSARERAQRAIILTVLAHKMDDRGEQSHGMFLPESDVLHRRVGTIKRTSMLPFTDGRSVMGHTRFATTGAIKEKNAHPFVIGGVTGMHNGTLSNHTALKRQYERRFPVDSMHIFAHLDEGLPLSEIEGYGTIVYTRKGSPGDIYLGTWNNGDLCVMRTDIGVVWASTKAPVLEALAAAELVGTEMLTHDTNLYVIRNADIYIQEKGFITCGGNNWRSWTSYRDEEFADSRFTGRVGSRRSFYNTTTQKWVDDETEPPVDTKGQDRVKLYRLALVEGMVGNNARRVFSADFDPYDQADEFYMVDGKFDTGLYWRAIECIDISNWDTTSQWERE